MLAAAGVVGPEPAVVGEVRQDVRLLESILVDHSAADPRHRDLETDRRGQHRGAVAPRDLEAGDGRIGIEIELHAAGAEGHQGPFKPGPGGDVRHRLTEGRQERLVVPRVRRRAHDQVRRVVVRVPRPLHLPDAHADERRRTDQYRHAEILGQSGDAPGEQRRLDEPVRDAGVDGVRLQAESRQHRLRPDGEVRRHRPGRRRGQREVHEPGDVRDLLPRRPGDLVVLGQVRLNRQHDRPVAAGVAGIDPYRAVEQVRTLDRDRRGRCCQQGPPRQPPHARPVRVHEKSADHHDEEAHEVRPQQVRRLHQQRPLDGGVGREEPWEAAEDELAARGLEPHPDHRRHERRRPREGPIDAAHDPHERDAVARQVQAQRRVPGRGHVEDPPHRPEPHARLYGTHRDENTPRRPATRRRQPHQRRRRHEGQRPQAGAGKGQHEQHRVRNGRGRDQGGPVTIRCGLTCRHSR